MHDTGPRVTGIEINVGTRRFGVPARPVLDDPDYAQLWQNNRNMYEAYQKKTTRPIPVVVLTP